MKVGGFGILQLSVLFFKDFIYLFIYFREREREGEREGEKHQCVVASRATPCRTWPATQARALTGNQTGDPLVRRLALNPLSHTRQNTTVSSCSALKTLEIYMLVINSMRKMMENSYSKGFVSISNDQ